MKFKHIEGHSNENIGESWEISAVKGSESVAANGPYKGKTLTEIIAEQQDRLVGMDNYKRFGNDFPLLIKFIDACQDLSIQVHPDEEKARKYGLKNGKTEMWYIMDSAPEAALRCGMKREITPEQYKKMVEDGIAVFHGFQEETRPYYAMADCVVLPSYHEGMSNVLLEASAMGRPVITSDIPGCREAVEDGKSGYLCEVKNADMLYEKMKQMVDKSVEERNAMGRCARERMEKLFDKRRIVEQTAAIISGK